MSCLRLRCGGEFGECQWSSSFSIGVNITNGQAHDLVLYALNSDENRRSKQTLITSALNGAVLDTQTVSSFSKSFVRGVASLGGGRPR